MSKIVEQIRNGDFEPKEHFGKNNPELRKLERLIYGSLEALENCLNENQRQIFENCRDNINELYIEIERQAFCDGFCLDSKMTAEAFVSADQLMKYIK